MSNTPATAPIAVVATVAHTDRRAISQAWYSALHIAEQPHAAPASGARAKSSARAIAGARPPASASRAERTIPSPHATPRKTASPLGKSVVPALDRRRPATELARRIERAVERAALQTQPVAALTIRAGDGRVQLLVRNDGRTTRIVAVCAETVRDRVERALAHARFSFAGAPVIMETH